jgi:hypothetical protein
VIARLRVAGLTLAVRSSRRLPGLRQPPRLRAFTPTTGADIALSAVEAAPPEPRPGSRLFDSGGLWSVYRHGADLLYVFREPLPGRVPYKALLIDDGLRQGTLFLPKAPQSGKTGYALAFPLDELVFQHRLAREGGFEVHACAARMSGGVVFFCGVSGAGKTTLAQVLHRAGVEVLSDDRVAVRPRGGRLLAYGTPWHGSGRFASPEGGPLRAVFLLKQAARSQAAPVTEGAVARIFARTFPPLWDARGVQGVLAACGLAAATVPVFELRFRKDRSALEAVRQALGPPSRGRPSR